MSDRFSFDAIFLLCKEEANEGGGGAGGRGVCGGLVGLGSHEELDVTQVERGVDCVSSTGSVFADSEEEEKNDTGEVCNCFFSRRPALGDGVHALEDGDKDRAHSSRERIFFCVCHKLLPPAKVDGAALCSTMELGK